MELKKLKSFPKNFLWGAATSSFQAEGAAKCYGKGLTVMDLRENDGSICNYDIASDYYHHYKRDIALMAEMGLKAYRFSIAWARIFPKGKGEINQEGVEFYRNVLKELKKYHIEPIVTIYHFDYPWALIEEYGGWINRQSIDDFVNYATYLFKEFGKDINYWLTINEQDHIVHMPYRLGLKEYNAKKAFQANHHMCVATALVIQKCHELLPEAKIGPTVSFDVIYPATCNPKDVLAYLDANEIRSYYILDLHCKGIYNKIFASYLKERNIEIEMGTNDLEIMKQNTPDFISLNYYASKVVEFYPSDEDHPIGSIDIVKLPSAEAGVYKSIKNEYLSASEWGWQIDGDGLQVALRSVYQRYGLPMMITENGLGRKEEINHSEDCLDDQERIDYIRKHLKAIKEVIHLGMPVIGYCHWSFMDVVSGHDGFKKRYGFIYINRNDHDLKDLKRIKKKSFNWYKTIIETNGEEI